MLSEVISNLTSSLQILNLRWNHFSSVSFEKLLTKIAECSVCSSLKDIRLSASTNFDSDESVRKLADILAIAPALEACHFSSEKIYVEVQYAIEGRKGAIVIRERKTKKEIHRRETDRQVA